MSEEGSPSSNSSLNLREFRIQKKPGLSHQQTTSGKTFVFGFRSAISNGNSAGTKRFQRIQVSLTSESDSDEGASKAVIIRKVPQNGIATYSRQQQQSKNAVVLEKERQMRFLLDNFPRTEAMVRQGSKSEMKLA